MTGEGGRGRQPGTCQHRLSASSEPVSTTLAQTSPAAGAAEWESADCAAAASTPVSAAAEAADAAAAAVAPAASAAAAGQGPDPIGEHEGLPTRYEPASPVDARGPRLGNSSPGTPSGWLCGAGSGRGRCGCVLFCCRCCRGCGRCFCRCCLSGPEVSPKIRRGVRGTRTSSSGRRSCRNSGRAERPTAACNLTSKRRAPSHERISAMVPCWPFKCEDTWRQVRRTRRPYISEEKVGCASVAAGKVATAPSRRGRGGPAGTSLPGGAAGASELAVFVGATTGSTASARSR